VFTYDQPAAGAIEWHLNFAHSSLFIAYGGPLFAQDEMQVAEHPVLACVRERLAARSEPGLAPLTREHEVATPVLIRGAQRRGAVATAPNADEGRPYGLYGNAFGRAPVDAVLRAARRIDPPTTSNILAMEAPSGAYGRYTLEQIFDILTTAYTGFVAARCESVHAAGAGVSVVVHTGHWGTGAYGGDRVLMAMLQCLGSPASTAWCSTPSTRPAPGPVVTPWLAWMRSARRRSRRPSPGSTRPDFSGACPTATDPIGARCDPGSFSRATWTGRPWRPVMIRA
jgi:hypothetical protein